MPPENSAGDAAPRIVLVVDDDADIRETLREVLLDEGYDAVAANDGREALAMLGAGLRPSVILLDLMMPVMTGWEFRAAQRKDVAIASIPVVVISATQPPRAQLDELGAHAVLQKPVLLERLLEVIAAAT